MSDARRGRGKTGFTDGAVRAGTAVSPCISGRGYFFSAGDTGVYFRCMTESNKSGQVDFVCYLSPGTGIATFAPVSGGVPNPGGGERIDIRSKGGYGEYGRKLAYLASTGNRVLVRSEE